MFHAVATGTALLASLAATIAVPSSAPPPGKFTVQVVGVNGSGCPSDSVGVSAAPDGTSFKLTYSRFSAAAGPGAAALDFRKNCQFALDVSGTKGWTWALSRFATSGSASLQSGATGIEAISYYWAGNSRTGRAEHTFTGPISGPWQHTMKIAKKSLMYVPCGERRYLNINLEVRVRAGTATGRNVLTMGSTGGSAFHIVWQKC